MPRPRHPSISSALMACAGVGGELEAAALRTLRRIYADHRGATYSESVHAVAEALAITPHALRRLVRAFGLRLVDLDIEIAVREAA